MHASTEIVRAIYFYMVRHYLLYTLYPSALVIICIVSCIKTAQKQRPREKHERKKWLQNQKTERQKLKDELLEEKQALKQEAHADDRKLKAKYRRHKRRYRRRVLNDAFLKIWLPILILCLVAALSVPTYMFTLFTCELKNEQFVVYEGPIEVGWDHRSMDTSAKGPVINIMVKVCYIPDNGKKKMIEFYGFEPEPDAGQYTGRIVYTKHSKFAVSMDLEPLP